MAILLNLVKHGNDVIIIILKLTNQFASIVFHDFQIMFPSVTHYSRCTMQGCLLKNLLVMLQSPSSRASSFSTGYDPSMGNSGSI